MREEKRRMKERLDRRMSITAAFRGEFREIAGDLLAGDR